MVSIHWLRRDLRLDDNAALYYALRTGVPVLPVFIFDTDILDGLDNKRDKRVAFIYDTLVSVHGQLKNTGSGLRVMHGRPVDCFKQLADEYDIAAVYTNHDYEPFAKHWKFGLDEYRRAFSKRLFLQRLRALIPSLEMDDLVPGRAGVRAMLLAPEGEMIDDFKIEHSGNSLHILNAPSPAATASLAIGNEVQKMATEHFNLS